MATQTEETQTKSMRRVALETTIHVFEREKIFLELDGTITVTGSLTVQVSSIGKKMKR
jgi:hypothetical protein